MREIKFRVYDIDSKRMISNDRLVRHYLYELITNQEENYRVMQYTGLKDKNDVEIYEGDILGSVFYPEGHNKRIVEYEDGSFYGMLIRNQFGKILSDINTECEVIGNIYENPELLND